MDHLTKKQRSENMRKVRSEDSKPEVILRSLLHRLGFRFRVNVKHMPGKPDVVLHKYKTTIFVHGCFWHGHEKCKRATIPSTNRTFWVNKLRKNKKNDERKVMEIIRMGWHPLVVWECEIMRNPHAVTQKIVKFLTGNTCSHSLPDKRQIISIAEKRRKYLIQKRQK